MIRHVVLFRLRPGVAADDPRVVAACREEDELVAAGAAGERGSWHFGADISRRAVSADFVGTGYFASQEDLVAFLDSAAHRRAAAAWEGLVDVLVADVDCAEGP